MSWTPNTVIARADCNINRYKSNVSISNLSAMVVIIDYICLMYEVAA